MESKSTKEKILEATLELISNKGYLGATTREMASSAGVTELTLFRHFGSKEQLFEEVLHRFSFLPELEVIGPSLGALPCSRALEKVAIQFLKTLKERKPLVRIILSEMNLYPEKVLEIHTGIMDRMVDVLADYLEGMQKKKQLRDFPAKKVSRIFFRGIFSLFLTEEVMFGRNLEKGEIDEYVNLYVDIFTKGTINQPNSLGNNRGE